MINLNNNKLLLKEYKNLIPGTKIFDRFDPFMIGQTPFFFKKGKGSYSWDADNNKYLDFHMSLGSIILGYSNDKINLSAKNQLSKGMTFSLMNNLEIETAKKLIKMIPSAEMVRFGKNGSDVLTQAVKLSRHCTNKKHVIFGGYHGWHDWVIGSSSRSGGIPDAEKKISHKFIFNDFKSILKLHKKLKGNIACIVMDLVARYYPEKNFLEKVRNFCSKNKILLVFDEIVTGFRIHRGGAQSFFNIIPDLSCFGKAMGNGMPISALVGKKKYMKKFDEVFYAMNFVGERASLAAAKVTLDYYIKNDIDKEINRKGNYLSIQLKKIIEKYKLNNFIQIQGMSSRIIIGFKNNVDSDFIKKKSSDIDKIVRQMIETFSRNKILCNLSIFVNKSHTKKDFIKFINVFDKICHEIAYSEK